jgi:sugar lactone lactonase YvrE
MAKFASVLLWVAIASAVSLSGCGGADSSLTSVLASRSGGPNAASEPARVSAPDGSRNLVYVSDQLQRTVFAFPAGEHAKNPPPAQTILVGRIPEGAWVDRNGILYVALSGHTPSQRGEVMLFKPGAATPFRTIANGISVPKSLVVDANGTLYVDQVVNTSVQILEYPAGKRSPSKTLQITDKGEAAAGGLTLDDSGNIYVHTFFIDDPPSRVFRFDAGKTVPHDLHLTDLGDATGLAGDSKGNLYVADSEGGIAVYAPGQTTPARKIVPPPNTYFADFVTTRSGELYVPQENANPSASSLLEYAVGGSQPVNVLSGHLQAPFSAALRAAAF